MKKKNLIRLLVKIGRVKQYDWWFSHDKLTIRSSLCSIAINRLHSVYSLNKICILLYHIWSIFCQCSHFILTLKTSENQSFSGIFRAYIFFWKNHVLQKLTTIVEAFILPKKRVSLVIFTKYLFQVTRDLKEHLGLK